MLAKLTSKNQITVPKAIPKQFANPEYFEITPIDEGSLLTSARVLKSDTVRGKLDALGITEKDIEEAVSWARAGGQQKTR